MASAELEAIVARCLEKAPMRRFPDAGRCSRLRGECAATGRGLRARPPRHMPSPESGSGRLRSLLVLPFENRSGDAAQEFFADGLTDMLIADLAQIGALRVISRTSAMRFKGGGRALSEIARELG